MNIKLLVIFLLLVIFSFIRTACGSNSPVQDVINVLVKFKLSNSNYLNKDIKNFDNLKCDNGSTLKVLVHGWLDKGDVTNCSRSYWYPGVRKPYLSLGSNVISVDWSVLSKIEYVVTSLAVVRRIGYTIADFVEKFTRVCKISMDDVHLIGHSLGAHIIGFAGKRIQSIMKQKIGRLTGLDPAGPVFKFQSDKNRLFKKDGARVDTIITDGDFQGMKHSCGHVNFYVNSGDSKKSPYKFLTHYFAPMMFQEGILDPKYVGRKCKSGKKFNAGKCSKNIQNVIGETVDFNKPGDFYLNVDYSEVKRIFFQKSLSNKWNDCIKL